MGTTTKEKRSDAQQTRYIISDALKRRLCRDGQLSIDDYVDSLLAAAAAGNMTAAVEINNRVEGKVRDEVKIDMSVHDHIPSQGDPDLLDIADEVKQIRE